MTATFRGRYPQHQWRRPRAGLPVPCSVINPGPELEAAIADLADGVTVLTEASAAKLQANHAELLPQALLATMNESSARTHCREAARRYRHAALKTPTSSCIFISPLGAAEYAEPQRYFCPPAEFGLTSAGPIEVEELPQALLNARAQGLNLEVFCVHKFPKMVNYVVPAGVRIADASRIRLGAYLGDGTTVMHEGFVNFNAGALANMVEGRISQGVIIGAGTDLAAAPAPWAPFRRW